MINKITINKKYISLLVTIGLFIIMFGAGSIIFEGFFSFQIFLNLFIDNAFLGITAIGMTFVILSGGIDLSVGSVIALTMMISAYLLEKVHLSPYIVIPLVLLNGAVFGCFMGCLIHFFKIAPFIVTLAGMFLARGLCYVISINSITITNYFFRFISGIRIHLPGNTAISINVIIFLIIVVVAVILAHYTKFGRTVYAIGGNEQSAVLMGLPVGRTKILIYTFNGFLSSLAGLVFAFYILSGYGLHAQGMELDAIASVVIGGTLLSGGVGYVIGTVFGVLILGVIQTLISFLGINTWWTKIVIGLLIFVFILMQRLFKLESEQKK